MKKKVLLVDDEPMLGRLVKSRLEASGYDVELALDGSDGVARANEWHPDLILLDILMPKMDGHEAVKHLKANNKTSGIPVVMLTAVELHRGLGQKCLEAGALELVAKPFDSQKLLEVIGRVFSGKK